MSAKLKRMFGATQAQLLFQLSSTVSLSALARNDPTLLAKNVQHHAKLVPHLPVGKSILLPRGKSTGRQLTCISALDRPVRPRHLVQEAERLTRALGVDDGKITPHAYGVDDNAGP